MADTLMTAAAIGLALSGKSSRTGRRFLNEGHIPTYLIHGRKYVRQADFEKWLELQKIEPSTQRQSSLKSRLDEISQRILAKRR